MSGLSRFDFYPRDWHLDTRDLSNAAKGVYIDLLSSMYARGEPLPFDERELCRLCGCATVRSLRPLLDELVSKGKLRLVDGHLVNGRTMEEIVKAERRQAIASEGGQAKSEIVQPEFELNSARTHREIRPDIVEKQQGSSCSPSPSPSYSPSENISPSGRARAREDVSEPAPKPEAKPKRRVRAEIPVPDDWQPDEIGRSYAVRVAGWSPSRITIEVRKFIDTHSAKGRKFSDIPKAWRKWVSNGAGYDLRDQERERSREDGSAARRRSAEADAEAALYRGLL
jgi:uncharacterized protein YdaU (DUF1376 family)